MRPVAPIDFLTLAWPHITHGSPWSVAEFTCCEAPRRTCTSFCARMRHQMKPPACMTMNDDDGRLVMKARLPQRNVMDGMM
ncbi:hypothetical protein DUNSADRAFT_12425 [Dunaliella salina]|uniref:Secreted protein n=1 Tax=Dunaliella salina TaxID=3046 RepID=A0ABQ7GBA0_DUNSA|nr:hypothetical protein DUNSADRAFT_12425 [Dunaliella salina]|eukprot:KAF5831888.1 hypothetical protein DUNSADRAFT_12425 [Dunaliella salina]